MKSTFLWMAINLLPASVLAAVYFLDLRYLTALGGGPSVPLLHGLGRLLAFSLGWPARDAVTVLLLLVPLLALTAWQLNEVRKSGDPSWIFLVLIYVMPFACMLFLQPIYFMARYFLVIVPFVYVTGAMLLARLAKAAAGRAVLVLLLTLFLAGQADLYAQFLRVGRGQMTNGLEFMIAHTPSGPLRLESNQDFRSLVELYYYAPRVLGGRQLVYVPQQKQGKFDADWYILHEEGYEPPGPSELHLPDQSPWYRVAYFGASELSGQAWTLYRHQPMP